MSVAGPKFAQLHEQRRKLLQANDVIHGRRRKGRLRHVTGLRRFGILHDGDATARLYGLKSPAAVAVRARQYDADKRFPERVGGAFKQHIDRGTTIVYTRIDREAEGLVVFDEQMISGRRNISVTGT